MWRVKIVRSQRRAKKLKEDAKQESQAPWRTDQPGNIFSRIQGRVRQGTMATIFGRALGYVLEPLPKTEERPPRNCSGFYKGIGARKRHKSSLHPARQFRRDRALKVACKQEGLGIKFEFTATNTPKQNGRIELMSAMSKQGTDTLWTKAADTATNLDNLIVRQGETKNSHQ